VTLNYRCGVRFVPCHTDKIVFLFIFLLVILLVASGTTARFHHRSPFVLLPFVIVQLGRHGHIERWRNGTMPSRRRVYGRVYLQHRFILIPAQLMSIIVHPNVERFRRDVPDRVR